nr:GTP-binding protein [Ruegeria atlantica]
MHCRDFVGQVTQNNTTHANAPVPVTIVAGFLGAGKSTLLNHILTSDHGLRTAVVVNDFGSINIDADLIADVGESIVGLANGCICCAIRSDLIGAVLGLVDLPERPDHILIEASGVADPKSVYQAFLQPEIRNDVLVDGVLTLVDAEQAGCLPEKEQQLACEQIESGDLIILNKVDLVDNETLREMKSWLSSINPRAQVIEACQCRLPVDVLLGLDARKPLVKHSAVNAQADHAQEPSTCIGRDVADHHHHENTFESWNYKSDRPLRLGLLNQVLSHLPKEVLRAKGFIYASDDPTCRHLLQMVGRRAVLSSERHWRECQPETRLVFIARRGVCNIPAINRAFDKCAEDAPIA